MRKLTWLNTIEWMFVYPQNSHVEILIPDVMILEGGAFGM